MPPPATRSRSGAVAGAAVEVPRTDAVGERPGPAAGRPAAPAAPAWASAGPARGGSPQVGHRPSYGQLPGLQGRGGRVSVFPGDSTGHSPIWPRGSARVGRAPLLQALAAGTF